MGRCGLNGSDGQQGEDRSGVDPVKRCAAFFVSPMSPDSETAALQCGRPVSTVPPFTRPDTWTRPPVSRVEWDGCRIAIVPAAADSCKNIRLSADAANPLNRSRNWRADGDGWVGAG
jgi:hypothetical protein